MIEWQPLSDFQLNAFGLVYVAFSNKYCNNDKDYRIGSPKCGCL